MAAAGSRARRSAVTLMRSLSWLSHRALTARIPLNCAVTDRTWPVRMSHATTPWSSVCTSAVFGSSQPSAVQQVRPRPGARTSTRVSTPVRTSTTTTTGARPAT